ncbi:MAG TPA: hypothetical protein VL357_11200 [Rariglobus sp.]|jgi:hypothetical protein|nr:hypothetical protein [Rariglobus sp.]
MDPDYPLLAGMVLFLVLAQLNQRNGSPVVAIFNRWLRWLIFSFGGAKAAIEMGWSDRPYLVVVLGFFLLWFLLETLYNWLAIHALSVSPLPLFPRFTLNNSGEEWPTHPRLLKIRDWLRSNGFKQVQALKAEVSPSIYLRVSVYQDTEAKIRAQITFLPQANGAISVCFSLSSNTVSGYRYVTDNLYLPFGGFYPETWLVKRTPWQRSLPKLVALHRDRLARGGEILTPWTSDPLADLNLQQRELEQINTELGFLFPHGEREEHGKISHEGRYRVWKEYWLLSYFGRSVRY